MEKKQNWYTNPKKYHFIYKTTCLITKRYYLGMHSTDNLNDGYIGSGTIISRSIKKYGKENHSIEILEHLFDRISLKKREYELITEEIINDPMCMNLALGGGYQWPLSQTPIARLSRKEGLKKFWDSDKSSSVRQAISKAVKKRLESKEARDKLSSTTKLYRASLTLEEKDQYSLLMQSIWAKGTKLNEEQSNRVKDSWKCEDHRLARAIGIKRAYESTDLKERRSIESKDRWKTLDYRKKYLNSRVGMKYKKKEKLPRERQPTKYELKTVVWRDKIVNSTIDVTQKGWHQLLAIELKCTNSTVKKFIKANLPELWIKCYIDVSKVRTKRGSE